ncbi:aldose epimerase family protein [Parvularcula lutaonensis]|uniref:Aldose epimerase family protein n=1 Tax=Parvularcula lutaonensis TaxID=491923 RepID=A0ABV7M745_9PROT|nr:aldose epimerase family protein [Parvularcula lutaonensis]GGY56221.1 aldose 1-epimerase [Parvularcula lutaonensis]
MIELSNDELKAGLLPYGARLVSVELGDGWQAALSPPGGDDDREDPAYIGAALGRYANRIDGGFTLDGRRFDAETDGGDVALHGGPRGFARREWDVLDHSRDRAVFRLESEDGDQGYPGHLRVLLTVRVEGRALLVSFEAETDQPTPVNLSYHPYFRLGDETVHGHRLTLPAQGVLATDSRQVPTGEIMPLVGGALDLSDGPVLGERIGLLDAFQGFDHCYMTPGGVRARLAHEGSGRSLVITSDAPAVQVYTGQGLSGPNAPYAGIAIEPQSPPDAPNHATLGDTILRPGGVYRRAIRYSFDWR